MFVLYEWDNGIRNIKFVTKSPELALKWADSLSTNFYIYVPVVDEEEKMW